MGGLDRQGGRRRLGSARQIGQGGAGLMAAALQRGRQLCELGRHGRRQNGGRARDPGEGRARAYLRRLSQGLRGAAQAVGIDVQAAAGQQPGGHKQPQPQLEPPGKPAPNRACLI